ncbi:MAG: hypothetical protein HQL38_20175, partial [Alphaproteobacteria bacterium]|nr:hypothetical protein [Alphaproteobacteria bacterium]
ANRIAHETSYPDRPLFAFAKEFDWDRIKKRKDIEHRDVPERSQALVAWRIYDPPPIIFVAYCKVNGHLKIISIRYANAQERRFFYG